MKILAISAGSVAGNTELTLLTALQAVQAVKPDATIQLIRLEEIRIGNRLITGQFEHPFTKEQKRTAADSGPDDRPFVLEAIMEADAIIIGAPVLNRGAAGLLKYFADKTLGPFQDVSVATEMVAQGRGERVDQRILKKRVAALVSVGGAVSSDWTTLGLPMLHQLLFPMGIMVVDQVHIYGAGLPGSVVLDDDALSRAAQLGRSLVEQASQPVEGRKYAGAPGKCPICNLNVVALIGGNQVECASCAARGTVRIVDGEVVLDFTQEGLNSSVFRMQALVEHGAEIKKVAGELRPKMQEIPNKVKPLLNWGAAITLVPPSLSG
ncbi:flavoprotein-like protein [Aspergillus pseudoustus]|uniref:Flavoprotein-like protein n=1 Tax=Aspergillus pseudoustus TaxID=1810923 RepID=A0ABR4K2X1_9EURO